MNIKKFATILLLLVTSVVSSQNYKKTIEKEFSEYLNSIVNMEFEKSMEYLTDDFFEIIPKEQMIMVMEKSFNNPDIEFELKDPKILNIDNTEKVEDKFYSLISYSLAMNMKFKISEDESEDEKKLRLNLTKLSFEKEFGSDNTSYNEKTEFYEVKSEKEVYAISNNGIDKWKFIVIDEKQMFILQKLLPQELIDRI